MIHHRESYEHFDGVAVWIWNLPSAWEWAKEWCLAAISPENTWVTKSIETAAPPRLAWD